MKTMYIKIIKKAKKITYFPTSFDEKLIPKYKILTIFRKNLRAIIKFKVM